MTVLAVRRRRFAVEYIQDLDPEAAARRAGYDTRSARATGRRLLADPAVQEAIKVAAKGRGQGALARVTRTAVVETLAHIAFARITDYVDLDEVGLAALPYEKVVPIQEVVLEPRAPARGADAAEEADPPGMSTRKVRIKLADRKAALVELCKILGYYPTGEGARDHGHTRELSETERTQRILALLERARARSNGPPAD